VCESSIRLLHVHRRGSQIRKRDRRHARPACMPTRQQSAVTSLAAFEAARLDVPPPQLWPLPLRLRCVSRPHTRRAAQAPLSTMTDVRWWQRATHPQRKVPATDKVQPQQQLQCTTNSRTTRTDRHPSRRRCCISACIMWPPLAANLLHLGLHHVAAAGCEPRETQDASVIRLSANPSAPPIAASADT